MDEKSEHLYTQTKQILDEHIARHNMRHTPERYEVLQAICQQPSLFSVEDIGDWITSHGSFVVSRSTLFNVVELFVEIGIVIKHSLQRAALYECAVHPKPRMLQICKTCGAIKEARQIVVYRALENIHMRGFDVDQAVLYLHGECSKCRRQRKKSKPEA